MYSKELKIVILKNRIAKLEKDIVNIHLLAKAKRQLRKLESEG